MNQYPPGQVPQYPMQPNGMPHYMPPSEKPKKKRSALKWLLGILIGSLLLCGVIVAANTGLKGDQQVTVTNSTSKQSGNTASKGSGTSDSNPATVAKVGETITINDTDLSCTLLSVHKLATDDYTKPKPGQEFIYVHIKLVNNGSEEQSYNPFDFHVKSGTGNITNEEIPPSTYTANNMLSSGKLSAKGSVEGDIAFQVPIGDSKAQFTWSPSIFNTSSQYAWDLEL